MAGETSPVREIENQPADWKLLLGLLVVLTFFCLVTGIIFGMF